MARSKILDVSTDLQTDAGSVLWSFVQGEQLEYPVTLDFLTVVNNYDLEAVLMEANNIQGDDSIPTTPKVGGVPTTLVTYVPPIMGAWNSGVSYAADDVVSVSTVYYKAKQAVASGGATPASNAAWEVYVPNKVYIRFPSTLTLTPAYDETPTVTSNIYGFFELSVTEPVGPAFRRTWKPMRGVVEFQFSPTALI